MSAEINPESPDGVADDTPKVYCKEDDDGLNTDDDLDPIKEDLVGEATALPASPGKSDGDEKAEKKPVSLYPAELTANLFGAHSLFNSGLASMLSPYGAGLNPYSSLYSTASHPEVEKAGLLPGQFGGLPNPFSPWANPYGAAAAAGAAALGGLRYPFAAGLRPQLPHMGANSPFNPQHVASTAAKAAEEKRVQLEQKKREKNSKPHIKKPLNAFMLYMKEQRAKVVSECTLKESAAINQILGRKWHALSKEEQQKYYEMARKEREKHMVLYPGWSARDNYGKRKKTKDTPPNGQMVEDYPNNDGGSAKKCRAVYGLEAQHLWCAPCRRKKKCVRYPEGENFPPSNDPNASLLGAGSPLALAHGMLQNSPLSPQFGQGSPTSFMSHSPLALMHDQQTLAAHLHSMSQFNQGMRGPLSAGAPHMSTLSHFQNLANQSSGKLSPNEQLNEQLNRHTPQSDEHSAGSGSVGAGPRIGTLHVAEVKLEEADDQLSPCVSPEPEEPSMKKMRMDTNGKIAGLNRSSIAT